MSIGAVDVFFGQIEAVRRGAMVLFFRQICVFDHLPNPTAPLGDKALG